MISLNFEHAKDPNYLGLREINRNSITMGPEGMIFIEKDFFPYPQIHIKIKEGKLLFQIDRGDHYLIHNGKRSKLPVVVDKGDRIEMEHFRFQIIDFENIKYTSYRNFTSQVLEETQNKPELINLVSQLTSYLD